MRTKLTHTLEACLALQTVASEIIFITTLTTLCVCVCVSVRERAREMFQRRLIFFPLRCLYNTV